MKSRDFEGVVGGLAPSKNGETLSRPWRVCTQKIRAYVSIKSRDTALRSLGSIFHILPPIWGVPIGAYQQNYLHWIRQVVSFHFRYEVRPPDVRGDSEGTLCKICHIWEMSKIRPLTPHKKNFQDRIFFFSGIWCNFLCSIRWYGRLSRNKFHIRGDYRTPRTPVWNKCSKYMATGSCLLYQIKNDLQYFYYTKR